MTLIVGIKCKDGVVVGADGAATFGAMGQRTIRQPVKKLTVLHDQIIIGVSGPIGLSQRFAGEIETLWSERKLSGKKSFEAMTIIRGAIWKHAEMEINVARVAGQILGPPATESALASAVVVLPVAKKPCLFQFDHQGAPEEATEHLPFVAIGIGQSIADPFLAFLRRIFWPDVLPNLAEGIRRY